MRVLLSGATGLVGSALAEHLSARGHTCWGLSRRARDPAPPFARWFAWDARGPLTPGALEGVDAVVHLAGENVASGRWTASRKQRIRDSRVLSTRALVDAIAQAEARPRVLLAASATGFYGDRGEELLREGSAPGGDFLAEVCVAWEAESARAAKLGLRVVQHRFGVVLARQGGALPKMCVPFRLGVGGKLGSGSQYFPWIHLDDAVGLLTFALQNDAVAGPLNTVAPHPVSNCEFTGSLARLLHRPAVVRAPAFALRLALGEMSSAVLGGQRVSADAAVALGYAFAFPTLGPALRDLLATDT